MLPKSINKW